MVSHKQNGTRKFGFPTSDGEGCRGLQLPHPVLCYAGERALIVDGGLFQSQHVVVLVVLDLVPAGEEVAEKDKINRQLSARSE